MLGRFVTELNRHMDAERSAMRGAERLAVHLIAEQSLRMEAAFDVVRGIVIVQAVDLDESRIWGPCNDSPLCSAEHKGD